MLATLCGNDAAWDRLASPAIIGGRLDVIRRATEPTERIKQMRLPKGQKLKRGRDIFGSGTRDDPYRFRKGLLYNDAIYYYLAQEGIQMRTLAFDRVISGVGGVDRVDAEDGRVLYFLDETTPGL